MAKKSTIFAIALSMVAIGISAFFYTDLRQPVLSAQRALDHANVRIEHLETAARQLEAEITDAEAAILRNVSAVASASAEEAAIEAIKDALDIKASESGDTVTGKLLATAGMEISGGFLDWRFNADGQVRSRISAGTVNFGNEVIMYAPGAWGDVRGMAGGAWMLMVASDLGGASNQKPVVAIRDHPNDNQGMLILGLDGDAKITTEDWRVALWTDRLLFAPSGYTHTNGFDAGIVRDEAGNLLLRSGGVDVVTLAPDSFTANGTIILNNTKADAGDPLGVEGMIYINTFDNVIKMYADGEWQALASW